MRPRRRECRSRREWRACRRSRARTESRNSTRGFRAQSALESGSRVQQQRRPCRDTAAGAHPPRARDARPALNTGCCPYVLGCRSGFSPTLSLLPQIIVRPAQPILPRRREHVHVQRIFERHGTVRHVAGNHQQLAAPEHNPVRIALRVDLVADPQAHRALQYVCDLLVDVMMLRHDTAGLQVHVRDHDLLARHHPARQPGVELLERHGGPRVLGCGGRWHVALGRTRRFDLAMRLVPLPIRRNSGSIRAMNTPARHRCLTVATLSLLLAVALPVVAQEEGQPTESSEPVSPPRRLFVSDKLVLNVYSEPERGEGFIRIRLPDGREGSVGSNYLTTDAPAAVQLRDLQRQQESSTQAVDKKAAEEIARLKKESESLQAQLKDLKAAAASAPAPDDDGVLEGAAPAPRQLAAVAPTSGGSTWLWLLIVALAAGLAYAAGYQSLARRIRKKFGGLRIY